MVLFWSFAREEGYNVDIRSFGMILSMQFLGFCEAQDRLVNQRECNVAADEDECGGV